MGGGSVTVRHYHTKEKICHRGGKGSKNFVFCVTSFMNGSVRIYLMKQPIWCTENLNDGHECKPQKNIQIKTK